MNLLRGIANAMLVAYFALAVLVLVSVVGIFMLTFQQQGTVAPEPSATAVPRPVLGALVPRSLNDGAADMLGPTVAKVTWGAKQDDRSREVTYLDVPSEPCTYRPIYNADPCVWRDVFHYDGGVNHTTVLGEQPPTYEELLINSYGVYEVGEGPNVDVSTAIHIVARATFDPDTTDCAGYPLLFPEWSFDPGESLYAGIGDGEEVSSTWNIHHWGCFTSLRVHEYLIGRGPEVFTVLHANFGVPYDIIKTPSLDPYADQLAAYKDEIALQYEGIEWVVWLAPSYSTAIESWAVYAYWDVQRLPAVTRVVSPDFEHYDGTRVSENELNRLKPSLDQFRRDIKVANQSRLARTSGRVGVGADTPNLVADAHELPNYYDQVGAKDNLVATPTLPPVQPSPPASLESNLPTESGITLSWAAPALSRVTGYKIVRRVPKGEFVTVVADTGSTDTTYTDTSAPMTAGATYIYRVLALNEYGESVASMPASIRVP